MPTPVLTHSPEAWIVARMASPRRLDIDSFLGRNRMHPRDIDTRACAADFLSEMTRGLQGRPSSLAMLPTFIETAGAVQADRKVS